MKKIFPEIKQICRKRGVDFSVVDLRWGISEEESRTGKVIEICVDEIERTRPYFIGLVGGRYGWIPDDKELKANSQLSVKYPWIVDYIADRKSVTEIEMLFGVLGVNKATNAFFYLRRLETIRPGFIDAEGTEARAKLEHLRGLIREKCSEGACLAADYGSPKELGRKVRSDLISLIDSEYPASEQPNKWERMLQEQAVEWQSLCALYAGADHRLSDFGYVESEEKPQTLVVVGEQGSGKSALLANYYTDDRGAVKVMVRNMDDNVETLSRLIYYAVAKAMGRDVSSEVDAREDFNLIEALSQLKIESELTLVVDGLDRVQYGSLSELSWIFRLPKQIRLVLSCDEELADSLFNSKDFIFYRVESLRSSEILEITAHYLSNVRKTLTSQQSTHLLSCQMLTNAKLLRTLLDIMIQFGEFERLDYFINRFVSTRTPSEFLEKVLELLEYDFDRRNISHIMTMLSLSQIGLPAEALRGHLGLNVVEWAAIECAIEPLTETSDGYIVLQSELLKDVVRKRYERSSSIEREILMQVAAILDSERRLADREVKALAGWKDRVVAWLIGIPAAAMVGEKNAVWHRARVILETIRLYQLGEWHRKANRLLAKYSFLELVTEDTHCYLLCLKKAVERGFDVFETVSFRMLNSLSVMSVDVGMFLAGIAGIVALKPDGLKELRRRVRLYPFLPPARRDILKTLDNLELFQEGRSIPSDWENSWLDMGLNDSHVAQLSAFLQTLDELNDERIANICGKAEECISKLPDDSIARVFLQTIAFRCCFRLDEWGKAEDLRSEIFLNNEVAPHDLGLLAVDLALMRDDEDGAKRALNDFVALKDGIGTAVWDVVFRFMIDYRYKSRKFVFVDADYETELYTRLASLGHKDELEGYCQAVNILSAHRFYLMATTVAMHWEERCATNDERLLAVGRQIYVCDESGGMLDLKGAAYAKKAEYLLEQNLVEEADTAYHYAADSYYKGKVYGAVEQVNQQRLKINRRLKDPESALSLIYNQHALLAFDMITTTNEPEKVMENALEAFSLSMRYSSEKPDFVLLFNRLTFLSEMWHYHHLLPVGIGEILQETLKHIEAIAKKVEAGNTVYNTLFRLCLAARERDAALILLSEHSDFIEAAKCCDIEWLSHIVDVLLTPEDERHESIGSLLLIDDGRESSELWRLLNMVRVTRFWGLDVEIRDYCCKDLSTHSILLLFAYACLDGDDESFKKQKNRLKEHFLQTGDKNVAWHYAYFLSFYADSLGNEWKREVYFETVLHEWQPEKYTLISGVNALVRYIASSEGDEGLAHNLRRDFIEKHRDEISDMGSLLHEALQTAMQSEYKNREDFAVKILLLLNDLRPLVMDEVSVELSDLMKKIEDKIVGSKEQISDKILVNLYDTLCSYSIPSGIDATLAKAQSIDDYSYNADEFVGIFESLLTLGAVIPTKLRLGYIASLYYKESYDDCMNQLRSLKNSQMMRQAGVGRFAALVEGNIDFNLFRFREAIGFYDDCAKMEAEDNEEDVDEDVVGIINEVENGERIECYLLSLLALKRYDEAIETADYIEANGLRSQQTNCGIYDLLSRGVRCYVFYSRGLSSDGEKLFDEIAVELREDRHYDDQLGLFVNEEEAFDSEDESINEENADCYDKPYEFDLDSIISLSVEEILTSKALRVENRLFACIEKFKRERSE